MKRAAVCTLSASLCFGAASASAQSSLYVGGHFRRERQTTVPTLKASGLDTVILFNIDVDGNGNLSTDGASVCRDGVYTFGASAPEYVADVTALKQGETSVYRIESCVGGWGNESYPHIRDFIRAHGAGPGTNLYENFKALKQAIPAIDVINNDDEAAYDVATATAFHVMLADLGFRTALAPYRERGYWEQLASNVNAQRPGAVDRVYIQVYDGGANNNPCDWHFGAIPLHAGMLHFNSTDAIRSQMTSWRDGCGVVGGFLWVYNAEDFDVRKYMGTLNEVFKAPTPRGAAVLYAEINYGGTPVGVDAGAFTLADLTARGLRNDDVASLRVRHGFEAELFWDDQYGGASLVRDDHDATLLDDGWGNQLSSLKVRPHGVGGLTGTYRLENRNSQLVMDTAGDGANGTAIVQAAASEAASQAFVFTDLGDGLYRIVSNATGKSLDIDGVREDNFAKLQLWDDVGGPNQRFIVQETDGGYHRLIASHSGRVVEVGYAKTEPGAPLNQYDDHGQTCGQWRLIPITEPDAGTAPHGDAGAHGAEGDGLDGAGDAGHDGGHLGGDGAQAGDGTMGGDEPPAASRRSGCTAADSGGSHGQSLALFGFALALARRRRRGAPRATR